MSNKKPIPLVEQPRGNLCPVCGKRSYSLGGVHPQCAQLRADEPRNEKNRAKKKAEKDKKVKKPIRRSWDKKCPQCGAKLHVRKKTCDCGYGFPQHAK